MLGKGLKGWNMKLATVVIATILWGIWKTLNRACFQRKWLDDAVLNNFLISLHVKDNARKHLRWLAKLVERVATEVFDAKRS
jgi:hypothetical protein